MTADNFIEAVMTDITIGKWSDLMRGNNALFYESQQPALGVER